MTHLSQDIFRSRLLVAVSALIFSGILLALAVDLSIDRQAKIRAGERSVEHFGRLLADQTARSMESIEILLGELALDFNHAPEWTTWSEEDGHRHLSSRHTRGLQQLSEIAVFDASGLQRFASAHFPIGRIKIDNRPYFETLATGIERTTFGPFIGHNSGRHVYGLARRLNGNDGEFAGAILTTYDPAHFQDICWSQRTDEVTDAALITVQGTIVSTCRPGSVGKDSPYIGRVVTEVLGDGKLAGLPIREGVHRHGGHIVSVAPVKGLPDLRVVTVVAQSVLLAPWQRHVAEVIFLIALALVAAVVVGRIIQRQIRELRRLTRQLRDSYDQLEDRVREATRELSRKKEDAERDNLSKSRFLAAASHDLRQPLHAIALFSADLRQTAVQPEVRQASQNIEAAVRVLFGLFENLLDISRLDLAGIKPNLQPVALEDIIERVTTIYARPAADKHLFLRSRPTSHWALTDPALLERLLGSLTANAIQYTEEGGVLIAVRRRGLRLRIEVRDSGIGIAEEEQPLIFDEFYQVANPERTPVNGLGLGLSIAARLAAALNTQIALRSRPGQGSVFAVEIPLATSGVMPTGSPAQAAPAVATPERPGVLVIGAPADLAGTLPETLERWGYTSRFVADREAATTLLADPSYVPLIIAGDHRLGNDIVAQGRGQNMVVLGEWPDGPTGCHTLGLPLKPAKLRALLRNLEEDAAARGDRGNPSQIRA